MKAMEIPARGHIHTLPELPRCAFCRRPATWEGPTCFGAWAYMCDAHEESLHLYPLETGLGVGQMLVQGTPTFISSVRSQIESAIDEAELALSRAKSHTAVKKPRRKPAPKKSTPVEVPA